MVSTSAWPGWRSSLESFFWGCGLNVCPGWMSPLGREARMTVCVVAIFGNGWGGRAVLGLVLKMGEKMTTCVNYGRKGMESVCILYILHIYKIYIPGTYGNPKSMCLLFVRFASVCRYHDIYLGSAKRQTEAPQGGSRKISYHWPRPKNPLRTFASLLTGCIPNDNLLRGMDDSHHLQVVATA